MDFHGRKAVYEQIGDFICGRILAGAWKTDERILSVRDLAVELQVNPNTVMRTCLVLEEKGILYQKQGVGLFVSKNGRERALKFLREEFIKQDLPIIIEAMNRIEMDTNDLTEIIQKHLQGGRSS